MGIVRGAFAAALGGDFDGLGRVLAEDVRWGGPGDDPGCTNRKEALAWMREVVARGVRAELLDVRPLGEDRVLVVLQRNPGRDEGRGAELPAPHAQIVTFRDGKVSEIIVYGSEDEAITAADV